MAVKVIGIGCTTVIQVDVRDKLSGLPLSTGTVKIWFVNPETNQMLPNSEFNLSPTETPGLWRAIIPVEFTETLNNNKMYKLCLHIDCKNGEYYAENRVYAKILPIP